MASLQTKTYSYGDLAYQSYSNAYVLQLVVTEESISQDNNTSEISYVLQLVSGSQNRFNIHHIGATVNIGSHTQTRARLESPQYSLGYNSSIDIMSGTATIAHDDDGSKTVSISFAIDMDDNEYTPGALSSSGHSMALTPISRQPSAPNATARIYDGSTHKKYAARLYNGGGFKEYLPYKYDGSNWAPFAHS